jgi:hypothetical protein
MNERATNAITQLKALLRSGSSKVYETAAYQKWLSELRSARLDDRKARMKNRPTTKQNKK